ncbi:TPA: nucleotide exchange factor GrpE [Candidatus Beckwithbacteria bacterium]|nr:nucleotide exchange factor GrpE [Candidatus Beckwithbacteria bacterium]
MKLMGKVKLENQLKRAVADYQNLKKRFDSEKLDYVKFANAVLLDKFLSVFDDLERAQIHLKDAGLNLVVTNFKNLLDSEGVAEIKVKGLAFDPTTMDCAELSAGPKDQVVKVIVKGYTLNGKVLRPARVKVGSGASKISDKKL